MPRKSTTRGANGGGTIRQRKNGTWEGRVTVGYDPGTGKQKQKSFYGKTQKEVLRKILDAAQAVDAGRYADPPRQTVRQWLETWLEEYTGNTKESTRTRYRQDMENHIFPALGAVKLSSLTADICQRFYNSLGRGEKPLSAKSIKNVHGVFHHALKQAARLGYIHSNPTDACTLPRIEKPGIEPLDLADIRALLAALGSGVYEDLIRFTLFTGVREGEALGLQWPCVDFDRGTIRIEKQLSRPRVKGEAVAFASLKNDKPRTIQPAPSVMQLLKERRRLQLEQRIAAGGLWDDHKMPDLVFTTETGKYLCYAVVLRHLKKACRIAGVREIRFHDLRHTFAVNSLLQGDNIKTVQENLGHHSAAFTLDQYAHVTDTMRADSARRMEALMRELGANKTQ